MSQRIEEAFGWIKEVACSIVPGTAARTRVGWQFTLAASVCDLIRLPKLLDMA